VGDTTGQRVARPRIRQRLRVIAFGLVLLPTLALLLLVRAAAEADRDAKLREMQDRREQVKGRAKDLARWLGYRADLMPGERREYFTLREGVEPAELVEPIDVDGSCADWHGIDLDPAGACWSVGVSFDRAELLARDSEAYDPGDFSFTIRTGTREHYLYVFVHVVDDEITFRRRGFDEGDQLRLVVSVPREGGASLLARFVVALERGTEGKVTTYQVDRAWRRELPAPARLPWGEYQLKPHRRPYGVWRPVAGGYTLELRLPLRTLGPGWREAQLGLAVVDNDLRGSNDRLLMWVVPQTQGTLTLQAPGARAFRRAWPDLDVNQGQRQLAVFDIRWRELFSTFAASAQPGEELLARAAALIDGLDGEGVAAAEPDGTLAAARVVDESGEVVGFVIERGTAPASLPRLTAILQESPLTAAILAGALLLLFLLLAYTRRLSRRILALVDHPDGDRDADDEIGELSRRLSDLIERDRAHREYLEQLPRILGHETLGPLGVVKMYIDDLDERDLLGHEARHERARRAIHSIENLIEDLREATSLEQALERGERIEVDLIDFLRDYFTTCRVDSDGALQIELPDTRFHTVVIERRIEQLLDKLLDNAADFSDGSPVRVSVVCDETEVRIRVENRGSQLPDGPSDEQLFAPMWSGRKRTTERHLGLGLYVARVIAEHHGGAIRAWNADGDHVIFEVTIRCSGALLHES